MAWLIWVPSFAFAVLKAPWRSLASDERMNVWCGMIVLLTLLWSLKAGVKPGLGLHLLGATVFTLSFGPALAFVGLSLVMLGICINIGDGYFAYALNCLLMAGVGVAISHGLYRLFSHFLPKHFFVYIFVNGFFAAALTVLGVGGLVCLLLAVVEAYAWEYLLTEYLPYFLLLGFAEAWISGMVMTLFVIYRPEWVSTFDDTSYLRGK